MNFKMSEYSCQTDPVERVVDELNKVILSLQAKIREDAEQLLWYESEIERMREENLRVLQQSAIAIDEQKRHLILRQEYEQMKKDHALLRASFDRLQKKYEEMNITCYRLKKEYRYILHLRPMRTWCMIQKLKGKPYISFERRKLPMPVSTENKALLPQIVECLPTVTVVIPTYKPNKYVEYSVASVLRSDYEPKKLQVILSVNGPDTAYAETLRKQYLDEPRVQVIYTSKAGAGAGRNFARQYIQTEYVTYLDDDDYFTPGYVREMAQHTIAGVAIICGRLMDFMEDGKVENDTYINRMLQQKGQGLCSSYLEIGAMFSTICGKLYKRELITDIYEGIDEDIRDTEDTLFWVKNIHKTNGKFYLCAPDSHEGYVRRILQNSRSRPDKESSYAFYITGRLSMIERFSEVISEHNASIEHKRFVLTKIDAQEKLMANYVSTLSSDLKEKAHKEILSSQCPFIRRFQYTDIQGIAFCHNFVPFIDASSFVAAKRLPQICEKIGQQIAWTVVCADMSQQRKKDPYIDIFFSRYQYRTRIITDGKTWFNEEAQEAWGQKAYEEVKAMNVSYIYSRSMWAGSHVAAALYKKAHPSVFWIAEFSDPIYMDTSNSARAPGKEYCGDKAYLNSFWKDIEATVFEYADQIIFTNENQKQYMLEHNPPQDLHAVLEKSQVWPHPILPEVYRKIIPPNYILNQDYINIGYFGTFYANRSGDDMLLLLRNEKVCLHMFTNVTPDLEELCQTYAGRLCIHTMVSHLEMLSIAAQMDYLYLNDIQFPGEIIPYQPSKLADYLSAGTPIIALIRPNTPMSMHKEQNLIKVAQIDDIFVNSLSKRRYRSDGCRSGISKLSYYKEQYVESISAEGILSIAQHLMEGKTDNGYNSLPMPALFDENGEIRWLFTDAEISCFRNTFFLYHYGLRSIYFLSNAYHMTGDESKLSLARKILHSFYAFFLSAVSSTEMLFNDHAMAERIENIIYFWDVANEAKLDFDREAAMDLVEDALEKLSGTGYYQRNHNHGIIADKACLIGYYFLNSPNGDSQIAKIIHRLKMQVDYAFGRDGIHKENSIDYHYTVVGMLCGCLNICKYIRHPFYDELYQKISDSFSYIVYALKPNLQRPLFGDSKGSGHDRNVDSPADQRLFSERFGTSELKYVLTYGKEGKKPETTAKWFPSGYMFMREHFEAENFSQATWLSLRAGYTTRVHKHQDDMSLCLYSRGVDIFVDGGMCGYMPRDVYKDYMESLPAHTTICIKDVPYSIASGNGELCKVWQVEHTADYDYTMASSYIYADTVIYRHLFYVRRWNIVVLYDDLHSENEHTYAQYFHLGARVHPQKEANAQCGVLYVDQSDLKIKMLQICPVDELRLLQGEETSPMSMLSTGFSSCIPTQTLEYSVSGKNVSFVTVIEIDDTAERTNYSLEEDHLSIVRGGKQLCLPLKKLVPVSFDGVSASCDENGLLTIHNHAPDFAKHTVYIIYQDGFIQKEAYSDQKTRQIPCTRELPAKIIYYVQNRNRETRKGLLGTLDKTDSGNYVLTCYEEVLRPVVKGCNVVKKAAGHYAFTVDLQYPLSVNVCWWIYKNGANYNFVQNQSLYFETAFTEPGEYVVMCSLRDVAFGEFFFYQFDKITITAQE